MTFYFYDLETSGINARAQRIMQFAGQRTDEHFNPIGEPQNWVVSLTEEVLPDPEAILVTGITPQKTLEEGYTEAEFLKLFTKEVLQPDTTIMGFNSVRFDDEFMRMTLWRNFYDPYEWQWQDGRSRWDLLDAVRMIRALRPEGIQWPFMPARPKGITEHGPVIVETESVDKKPVMVESNRLELLTKVNGLDHANAHDALSDVYATIAVAKLLKQKQPKIFEYLLKMRSKKEVARLVGLQSEQPYLYTSGRYSTKWQKTTAAATIASVAHGSLLVFDLRCNPAELNKLSDDDLMKAAFTRDEKTELLPVKTLKINACPAVAPLGVLDEAAQKRLGLSLDTVAQHFSMLAGIDGFGERIVALHEKYQEQRSATYKKTDDPDFQLYDGFVGEGDKTKMRAIRAADQEVIADLQLDFSDSRLVELLPRYKLRNFKRSTTAAEREHWESYRTKRITDGIQGQLSLDQFAKRLQELSAAKSDDDSAQFLLQELQLYAQNIAPIPE
jgi:exodeoxyribonuclease-1